MTRSNTKNFRKPAKGAVRSDSLRRRCVVTSLRLFGLWLQLVACDPSVAVPQYESAPGTDQVTMAIRDLA